MPFILTVDWLGWLCYFPIYASTPFANKAHYVKCSFYSCLNSLNRKNGTATDIANSVIYMLLQKRNIFYRANFAERSICIGYFILVALYILLIDVIRKGLLTFQCCRCAERTNCTVANQPFFIHRQSDDWFNGNIRRNFNVSYSVQHAREDVLIGFYFQLLQVEANLLI